MPPSGVGGEQTGNPQASLCPGASQRGRLWGWEGRAGGVASPGAQGRRQTRPELVAASPAALPALLGQHGRGQRPWELTKWAPCSWQKMSPPWAGLLWPLPSLQGDGDAEHCKETGSGLGSGSPHPHPRTTRMAEVAVCLSRAQVPRGVCFPQPASLLLSWEQTQLSHEPADCQPHGWAWPTREELHGRALPETLTCEPNGLIFEASAFLGICHAALL